MSKPDVNNNQLLESLSALMDGEASDLEMRRLLKSEGAELNARWQRYHIASAALKGELKADGSVFEDSISMNLAASISAAIDQEPALSVQSEKASGSGLWSNMARFGVAASVVGAVIVGIQFASLQTTTVATVPAQSATNPNSVLSPDTTVRVVGQEAKGERKAIIINEATQQQLKDIKQEANRLMLEHAQNASQHTQQGVLPHVRVPEPE